MGLASALTTALTGMTAAETQIDVVGNNLANAQTVAFKESSVQFATQFLQTLGLGSAPTDQSGGTNPRQIGLGTQVAEIAPTPSYTVVKIEAEHGQQALLNMISFLNERDIPIASLEILEPNLESIFLHLTGKKLRE